MESKSLDKHLSSQKKEGIELALFMRNVIPSLIISLPGMLQYYYYGRIFYLIAFIGVFFFVISLITFGRIKLILLLPIIFLAILNSGALIILGRIIGEFDYLAVYKADFMQVITFIHVYIYKFVGFSIVMIVFFLALRYSLWLSKFKWIPFKGIYISRKLLAGLLLCSILPFLFAGEQNFLSAYPFSIIAKIFVTNSWKKKSEQYSKIPYKFSGVLRSSSDSVGIILIIGESTRRDAFGFNLTETSCYSNSPEMDQFVKEYPHQFAILKNYIATGQSTFPTVLAMLHPEGTDSLATVFDYPNLIKLLKGGGFATVTIKTTTCSILDKYLEVSDEIYEFTEEYQSLPLIKQILVKPGKNLIIFHTKDNHISKYGTSGDLKANYRQSIGESDKFLKALFSVVFTSPNPTCAWYASDHGENLGGNDGFCHGGGNITKSEIEITSFIGINQLFLKKFPELWRTLRSNSERLLSHNNLSHTIMGLSGVAPKQYYHKERDFSSNLFKEEKDPILVPNSFIPVCYSSVMKKNK